MVKYLNWLREGRDADIANELNGLPACEKWIVVGRKINYVHTQGSSSDSDMDADDSIPIPKAVSAAAGTSHTTVQEEVEPGWTLVKSKK